MAAPKPAEPKAAPAPKVKHHTHVHPFWAFTLWLVGMAFWCGLSVGPGQYLQVYLMREALYAEPEYATVSFHEPAGLLEEATASLAATPAGCRKNPAGGLSCEPADAPVIRTNREPAVTDLRLAAIAMNTTPWKVQFLPPLLSGVISYVGGTLMFLLCLLLGSRRG